MVFIRQSTLGFGLNTNCYEYNGKPTSPLPKSPVEHRGGQAASPVAVRGQRAVVRERERQIGFGLLDRTTRRVVFSASGVNPLELSQRVLRDVDSALSEGKGLLDEGRGWVIVAALPPSPSCPPRSTFPKHRMSRSAASLHPWNDVVSKPPLLKKKRIRHPLTLRNQLRFA